MSSRVALRQPNLQTFFWILVMAASGLVGVLTVSWPPEAVLLGAGATLVALMAFGRISVLVPLATVGLILGSSSILGGNRAVFWGKFALIGALGAIALVRMGTALGQSSLPRGFAVALLLLVLFAITSTLYSLDPSATFQHGVALLLLWLAVAVAVPLHTRTESEALVLLKWIAVTAAVAVLLSVLLHGMGIADAFSSGRFSGPFSNPNTLGYFLAPILPALIVWATSRKEFPWWLLPALVVLGMAVALSASRAGLLAMAVGTGVGLAALRRSGRAVVAVIAIGLVLGVGLASRDTPLRPGAVEGLFELGTGSGRVDAWEDGWRISLERPLSGQGFATTPIFFREARDPLPVSDPSAYLGRLHNSYLEAAVDLGWPATVLLVSLVMVGILAAWRLSRDDDNWPVGAVLLAGIVGGAVEGVFETGLMATGGMLAFHFWLLVGTAHGLKHRLSDQPQPA